MKKLLFLLFFVLNFSLFAFAQNEPQPVSGFTNLRHTFKSENMGEERTLLVHVPSNYTQSDEKYPVVYMLDAGSAQMTMMVGILEQQANAGEIPQMILVGITNTNRNFDLTPTANGFPGERGNGEKFMQFVEKEVVPMIDKGYRTQPFRIFAGHSFGGLTVVYSFVSRPDLFNAYLASSPALHWDNRIVIKRAEELFKQKREWNKTMFMAIANEPGFLGDANAFRDLLKKYNPKNFDFDFQEYKDETHGSSTLIHYYTGLRMIFKGWLAPENASFEDLESHYKNLTKRFGYQILIPENKYGQFMGRYLQSNQNEEAIILMEKAIASYPNSAGAYNALGIIYERIGNKKLAKENYEKAYKLAESQKNEQIFKEAKGNFERLVGK
ncbi:MAG: tetratricopeptide repeat protein [Pyrinomonadaceae bacterium]|nr:tetratricopeptide repeat protein [Pyrinomonadaceae bacterium]